MDQLVDRKAHLEYKERIIQRTEVFCKGVYMDEVGKVYSIYYREHVTECSVEWRDGRWQVAEREDGEVRWIFSDIGAAHRHKILSHFSLEVDDLIFPLEEIRIMSPDFLKKYSEGHTRDKEFLGGTTV